jgi:hypothetical protein
MISLLADFFPPDNENKAAFEGCLVCTCDCVFICVTFKILKELPALKELVTHIMSLVGP